MYVKNNLGGLNASRAWLRCFTQVKQRSLSLNPLIKGETKRKKQNETKQTNKTNKQAILG